MNKFRFTSAFSVPELIVVIAIIGFLVAASAGSYNSYRVEARDAQRIATIGQIHLALKQYASVFGTVPDCNDTGYPGGCDLPSFGSYASDLDTSMDDQFIEVLVTAGYLPDDVVDPLNDGSHYYAYATNVQFPSGSGPVYDIFLVTMLEDVDNPILDEDINDLTGIENVYVMADNI